MWWTSRGSPDSTTSPVCRRVPSRTRWWCTPAVASSAGIGARSAPAARSEMTMMLSPFAISSEDSRQRRSIARARPSGPSSTGQVASSTSAEKTWWSTCFSFSSSKLRSSGWPMISWCACSGDVLEQVRLRADRGLEAHHDALADRVDRRVRDLREELLEVAVERRRLVGQDGQREVVAHRAGRLRRQRAAHVAQRHAQVLLRVAEHELARDDRVGGDLRGRDVLEVVEVHASPRGTSRRRAGGARSRT